MTVANDFNTKRYQLNGSATEFDTEFLFFDSSQIRVYLIANDSATQLTEGADYSVSGAEDPGGGTVTYPLSGSPGDNAELLIQRILPILQDTSFRNQGAYYPETVEQVVDESRMIDQQQQDALDRTLKRDIGENNWNAEGRRITNVADAVDQSDAATLNQVGESSEGDRSYTDAQVAAERNARIADVDQEEVERKAADAKERNARQAADANLQAQIGGQEPLESSAFSPISWHDQVIENSTDIPPNKNAWSFGPTMTIAEGQAVTVGPGAFYTIANGQAVGGAVDEGTL